MKRPFFLIGTISLIISWLALSCNTNYILIASGILAIVGLTTFLIFRKRLTKNSNTYVVILVITVFVIMSLFNISYVYSPTSKIIGTSGTLDAVVISEPDYSHASVSYILKGNYSRLKGGLKCRALTYGKKFDIGDRVVLKVSCAPIEEEYKHSSLSDGIFVSVNIDSIETIKKGDSFFYTKLGGLRNYMRKTITKVCYDNTAGVLLALLTGDRSKMDDSFYDDTKLCGVTHIMVVSGMHVAILSSVLSELLKKMRLGERTAFFILSILFMFIVAICDFHFSAIRSVIMSLIMLIGTMINRRSDALNSLGFAVTVMALFNPFISGSVSFLLSVFATFGVVFVYPMLSSLITQKGQQDSLHILSDVFLQPIILSVSAIICILPITVYYFGYFSIISPIVNLLIGVVVEAALISVAAGVIISLIPVVRILSFPILFVSGLFAKYIIIIIQLFSKLKFFVININSAYANICFIVCAIFIFVVMILFIKKKKERSIEDVALRENLKKLS